MGDVLYMPGARRALHESVKAAARVRRVAVDLHQLANGRYEITLRREEGFSPICAGVYPTHAEAWQVAFVHSERLRVPLCDFTIGGEA